LDPLFLIIDLFCGAGGTTCGFERTNGLAKVIACINHDPMAIESHWQNHPDVVHFEEDIRTLKMRPLVDLVGQWKVRYPNALVILWASLECTNFSKAKGGLPREADSRTLADHLDRYVLALKPDYVQIENVVEFMSWGPLDENGKPVSRKNGSDWMKWRNRLCSYGYRDEWRELNSANFGSFTSRNRLFGIFAAPGLPIAWPEATHAKKPTIGGMHGNLQKWKAVKEVLDFSIEGESIFTRKKPLVEKTLQRIYAGLIKYVAGGKDAFMLKYNSINGKTGVHHPPSVDEPCPVVAAQSRLGLVQCAFISKYYSGRPEGKIASVEEPAGTITTAGTQALVQASFIASHYSNGDNVASTENPCPTLTVKDRHSLVTTQYFLDKQYSGDANHQSIDQPSGSIMPNDKHALIETTHFIDRQFSQGTQHQSIEEPAGALLTVPKMGLVSVEPWIMNTNHDRVGQSIEDPLGVITANRKHHYLMNPQYLNNGGSIDNPCFTLIARMDKMPPYLVQVESGEVYIQVLEEDCHTTRLIKQFMAMYGIVDIKMRMLMVPELLRIQGFPQGYKLAGNQADQKKFIGNSVEPVIPKVWTEAMAEKLIHHKALVA
jgi:DNA (cytosine-5)-methyltransferase 1